MSEPTPFPALNERSSSSKRGSWAISDQDHYNTQLKHNKRRKLRDQGEERVLYTIPHSLAPSTVTYFRTATTTLASHLNTLGLSPTETFMASLRAMTRTSPTKVSEDDLLLSLRELHGIEPHVLGASFLIRNELVALISQGYTLEEAVHILTNRIRNYDPSTSELTLEPPQFELAPGLRLYHHPQQSELGTIASSPMTPSTSLAALSPAETVDHRALDPSCITPLHGNTNTELNSNNKPYQAPSLRPDGLPINHCSNDQIATPGSDHVLPIAMDNGDYRKSETNPRMQGEDIEIGTESTFIRLKRQHHSLAHCPNTDEREQNDELAVPLKRFCAVETPN